jgi:Outer membrane protein beta-barrel domain
LKSLIFSSLILFAVHFSFAQSIGVRAGLNYSTFSGPLETNEKFGLANGIHFGISYGYKFTNTFMLRTELLYNQMGSKQKFDGENSYYLIYSPKKTEFEKGRRILDLEISNSYISLPFTAVYQLSRKFEIYGGLSPSFLINPTARGLVRFTSKDNPTEIVFKQALDYRYYSDLPGEASTNSKLRIIVDGEIVELPKSVKAYYQTDALFGSSFNWFNLSAIGGVNFFINKGFYVGARYEYGLLDVTNNKMDHSITELNEDYTFKKRNDSDKQLSLQISLGFKF